MRKSHLLVTPIDSCVTNGSKQNKCQKGRAFSTHYIKKEIPDSTSGIA